MEEVSLDYLAGFVDGEGCILFSKRRSGFGRVSLVISNTNLVILEKIKAIYGGAIYCNKGILAYTGKMRKDVYNLKLSGGQLDKLLPELLNRCFIKKVQLQIATEFRNTVSTVNGSKKERRMSVEILTKRCVLSELLSRLNKKGVNTPELKANLAFEVA